MLTAQLVHRGARSFSQSRHLERDDYFGATSRSPAWGTPDERRATNSVARAVTSRTLGTSRRCDRAVRRLLIMEAIVRDGHACGA
jgi:hypothetical protein